LNRGAKKSEQKNKQGGGKERKKKTGGHDTKGAGKCPLLAQEKPADRFKAVLKGIAKGFTGEG